MALVTVRASQNAQCGAFACKQEDEARFYGTFYWNTCIQNREEEEEEKKEAYFGYNATFIHFLFISSSSPSCQNKENS